MKLLIRGHLYFQSLRVEVFLLDRGGDSILHIIGPRPKSVEAKDQVLSLQGALEQEIIAKAESNGSQLHILLVRHQSKNGQKSNKN